MSPDTLISDLLIPMIFANGLDDDTSGMLALIRNERVRTPNGVIKQPNETIELTGCTILIDPKRLMLRVVDGQGLWISPEFPLGITTFSRLMRFERCHFKYKVQGAS